ncbi:MAG: ATP-binding protein [Actinomycetota bacterium]|nr:ATP-binding protein [Actinomycetota bacterium]
MGTSIVIGRRGSGGDGYREDLPLDRDLDGPIIVDLASVGWCHPMFAVRLRMFIDWHLLAGNAVTVLSPTSTSVAGHFAAMGVFAGLPELVISDVRPPHLLDTSSVLPVRRLASYHDVEDAAADATEVLGQQSRALAAWGGAAHMAISELCDNAIQHGKNELGAYVAADRVLEPARAFRLAIADLGIGIPEHIRARYPEWQDDAAAIGRALERGVTGTGDPHRGNGFAEVFSTALDNRLVRAHSAAVVDIRSAKGRVSVELVGGVKKVETPRVVRPRRGTWITYTVTSV